jgi:hypothetical protein
MKKSLFKIVPLTALLITIANSAQAAGLTTLIEGFNNINTLSSSGWAFQNNSNPAPAVTTPTANWTQGNPSFTGFNAQSGATNSYISVDGFESSAGDLNGENGVVSNWLITPELNFQSSAFVFYTRTSLGATSPYLEVRLSSSGASTNVGSTTNDVGDFATVITTLGSLDGSGPYPGRLSTNNIWQGYAFYAPTSGSGRIAFRYYTPSGGPSGNQSSIIGIDTVYFGISLVELPPVTLVPEPSSVLGLLTLGCFGLTTLRRGKSKKVQA